jgi:hypothetical protein
MLVLNDMRSSKIEHQIIVCAADTREELVAWIDSQYHSEPDLTGERKSWKDGNWSKCFRKGCPLEWFNPPGSPSVRNGGFFSTIDESLPVYSLDCYGHGIVEVMGIEDFVVTVESTPFSNP